MLCRDCRRQVTRGAAFCGALRGAAGRRRRAARARAGRRRARAARRRRPDRPRAGVDAAARGPERLAHARAHLGERRRRPDRGRRARATARTSTARGSTAPVALRDGARIRIGDQELTRRAAARRAPRRGGRSSCGRARRSSSARSARRRRGGAGDAVRHAAAGALRLRAQAAWTPSEGARRWVLRDLVARRLPAAVGQRRAAARAARRDALARRPDRRGGARASARPARRGSRACSPTSASAASSPASRARRPPAEEPASFWRRLDHAAREDVPRARARCFDALYRARRLGAVHAAGAVADRARCASSASACSAR